MRSTRLLAVLLAVNAVLCWRAGVGDDPSPAAVRALAGLDLVFAAAVAVAALVDLSSMASPLRWTLLALGDVVAVVGVARLVLAAKLPARVSQES